MEGMEVVELFIFLFWCSILDISDVDRWFGLGGEWL